MDATQAYMNWNHMYEYQLFDEWCPCHVLNDLPSHLLQKGICEIYNAHGSVDTVPIEIVRKMSKEDYLAKRSEDIAWLKGKIDIWRLGYHENVKDDLTIYTQSNDLEDYKKTLANLVK